jgi:tripartite-type tricarboxylate transporter receptor subunit TctC
MTVASAIARVALGLGTLVSVASAALAQGFPSKPIKIVVTFPPGGGTDVMARMIAKHFQEAMAQTVTIENRPGAGGVIGLEYVVRSEHDGHTLVMMPSNHAIIGPLYGKLPFDPIADFAPIALVGASPVMIGGHPSFPAKSFQELIAWTKSNPGKLNFASCGPATPQHLAGEMLKVVAGIEMTHIPYKGCGPALVDVLGGQVPVIFSFVPHLLPQINDGKLRGYAVTGAQRTSFAPEIPTVAEMGYPTYNIDSWFGLLAPGRTPKDVVAKLNAEVNKALTTPEVKERLAAQFYEGLGGTPERFGDVIRSYQDRFGKLIKDFGIKP